MPQTLAFLRACRKKAENLLKIIRFSGSRQQVEEDPASRDESVSPGVQRDPRAAAIAGQEEAWNRLTTKARNEGFGNIPLNEDATLIGGHEGSSPSSPGLPNYQPAPPSYHAAQQSPYTMPPGPIRVTTIGSGNVSTISVVNSTVHIHASRRRRRRGPRITLHL